ncbi:MAG: hypothetical protein AEth_00691 [Candidatus Argoarchaeum ethanivorans]|uniref:Uncharacterized protein n=1 Tax=Candidatus Argoarchaeum ethanivorans TaxID=2608793 RepID=A0A8B3S391_9EURY|nr:MAG: hypothetical protein AEth_00691 [Candidatus Argoarchaeum ethanivorans]
MVSCLLHLSVSPRPLLYHLTILLYVYPNVAKVEDTTGPPMTGFPLRSNKASRGYSCSRLPQGLDNEGDAVSSAFRKVNNTAKKSVFIGCHQRLDLMMVTPINAKPLSKPFNV